MFAPIALFADCAGTLEVGDATEVRARTTQQSANAAGGTAPATTGAGLDLYTQPMLTAHVTDRIWAYDLIYRPSLIFQNLQSDSPQLLTIHSGSATVAWRQPRVRLALTEDASYGSYNSANILPPSVPGAMGGVMPPPQLSPSPKTISFLCNDNHHDARSSDRPPELAHAEHGVHGTRRSRRRFTRGASRAVWPPSRRTVRVCPQPFRSGNNGRIRTGRRVAR